MSVLGKFLDPHHVEVQLAKGGKTTVLDTKITGMHRLPASYFVTVSYMCWASRRRKLTVKGDGEAAYD